LLLAEVSKKNEASAPLAFLTPANAAYFDHGRHKRNNNHPSPTHTYMGSRLVVGAAVCLAASHRRFVPMIVGSSPPLSPTTSQHTH
jgi:hypothetical protein